MAPGELGGMDRGESLDLGLMRGDQPFELRDMGLGEAEALVLAFRSDPVDPDQLGRVCRDQSLDLGLMRRAHASDLGGMILRDAALSAFVLGDEALDLVFVGGAQGGLGQFQAHDPFPRGGKRGIGLHVMTGTVAALVLVPRPAIGKRG